MYKMGGPLRFAFRTDVQFPLWNFKSLLRVEKCLKYMGPQQQLPFF
jgi:hypothetical protein